jgi:hypothetical protein
MTPEEIQDLKGAWQRLSRATSYLVPAMPTCPEVEPDRAEVGKLVDECRQALTVILLIAGPEGSLDQEGINNLMALRKKQRP